MMRRLLTNNWFIVSASAGCLAAGAVVSILAENFQWLSRFGALVICAGVIALARPGIAGSSLLPEIILSEGGRSNNPDSYIAAGKPVPPVVLEDRKSQIAVSIIGPWLCLVGTATNGFADLINKLVGW